METKDVIEQLRIARYNAHEMVVESHHCASKMHEFIGNQYELISLSTSQQLISSCETSKRIISEMEDHIRSLEEIQNVITQVLENYECAMQLVLTSDTVE